MKSLSCGSVGCHAAVLEDPGTRQKHRVQRRGPMALPPAKLCGRLSSRCCCFVEGARAVAARKFAGRDCIRRASPRLSSEFYLRPLQHLRPDDPLTHLSFPPRSPLGPRPNLQFGPGKQAWRRRRGQGLRLGCRVGCLHAQLPRGRCQVSLAIPHQLNVTPFLPCKMLGLRM